MRRTRRMRARRREQDRAYRVVVGPLAVLALALGLLEVLLPGATPHAGPVVLSAATVFVGWWGLRRSRGAGSGTTTLRALAGIAGLLALGQLLRAGAAAGVNPRATGLPDLVLAATGPVALFLCARLVRGTRGRVRPLLVLDGLVALLALGLLLVLVVPVTVGRSADGEGLLAVGYPAVGALLCAVGLVTFAGVSASRRRAAGWLLACFASLAVATVSGALALADPSPWLDALTSTGYLAMLAAGTLAVVADADPRAAAEAASGTGPAAVPMIGVVVSSCLGFGGTVLVVGAWASGGPIRPVEVVLVATLLVLTFVRTLVWARDGARLTRQVLRAETYFRTLVHRSADVTVVLDDRHEITWVTAASGTVSHRSGRDLTRELQGLRLADLVHEDDRAELDRVLTMGIGSAEEPRPVLRVVAPDGTWRRLEVVATTSSAGLPFVGGHDRREGIVLHLRAVTKRRITELELERLAYSDYLTGLPNRARLMAAIAAARSGVAHGAHATLLLLDLDGFKPVNDIAGHEAGDQLLVQVAERLRATVRNRDLIGRLGGDEFAVLVRAGADEAALLAERIVGDVARLRPTASTAGRGPEAVFDISVSIGLAPIEPGEDLATTVRHADLALRAAKAAGKNCVRRHGETADDAAGRRARLAEDLPGAIDGGQLRLVFQPVAGVAERRVLGVEALVRWQHPDLGPVPPDEFISLAEADGLIVPLQRWVLEQATATLAPLLREGRDLQLGVNISVRHLQAGCLAADVANALAASGVPAGRLMIEITESVLMSAEDRMDGDLGRLREMGCVLSLDDFGKGHSSLARLARLPVDVLKMDRDFVAHIEDDWRTRALIATVVELGGTLGLDVVAEGVETTGQLALLRDLGCRFLQGYLLGRPVPAEELRPAVDGFDPSMLDTGRPTDGTVTVHTVGMSG